MTPPTGRPRRIPVALAGLALMMGGLLAGCTGGDGGGDGSAAGEPSPTESSRPAPYDRMDLAEDLELTDPGTELEIGEAATVAWQPRAESVGVLEITVDRVRQARWRQFKGWNIDRQTRRSTPFFVDATVTNAGEGDLGGTDVPLYLLDGTDTLIQPSEFKGRFKPCPSRGLPKSFEPGAEQQVCLVYLAPQRGSFQAMSFRPAETFDAIRWTGDVANRGN